jgi:hypothetical protein
MGNMNILAFNGGPNSGLLSMVACTDRWPVEARRSLMEHGGQTHRTERHIQTVNGVCGSRDGRWLTCPVRHDFSHDEMGMSML